MIEYSFWVDGKDEGVEALVFDSHFDQGSFTTRQILKNIVNEPPKEAKATRKTLVLPDPVLDNRLVYNGNSKGRKYLTVITNADGEEELSEQHLVKGVKSIPYTVGPRGASKIEVFELKKAGEKKQVFEMVL